MFAKFKNVEMKIGGNLPDRMAVQIMSLLAIFVLPFFFHPKLVCFQPSDNKFVRKTTKCWGINFVIIEYFTSKNQEIYQWSFLPQVPKLIVWIRGLCNITWLAQSTMWCCNSGSKIPWPIPVCAPSLLNPCKVSQQYLQYLLQPPTC